MFKIFIFSFFKMPSLALSLATIGYYLFDKGHLHEMYSDLETNLFLYWFMSGVIFLCVNSLLTFGMYLYNKNLSSKTAKELSNYKGT
jgi:hypothetical protein